MRITVVADETGAMIAAVHHPQGESVDEHPQGIRVVPQGGQVAVTVEAPEALAEREFGADYFEALRGYEIRDGSLIPRA